MNNETNNFGNQIPNNNQNNQLSNNNQQFMNQAFQQPMNNQMVNNNMQQVTNNQFNNQQSPYNNMGQQNINNQQSPYNNNNQQFMNSQPIYNNQMGMPMQMPNNNQNQKSSKKIVVIIVVILAILLTLAIIIVPFVLGVKETVKYRPNQAVDNLSLYIPTTWQKQEENKFKSPSGDCEVMGGTMQYDIETVKSQYLSLMGNYGLTFNKKTINGYDWDYAYVSDSSDEIYMYLISNDLGKYMIMFRRDLNGLDEECEQYIEYLEESITLQAK